jgi:hypothetical protein
MNQIHQQLEMPDLKQQFGTQMYEQQVVQLCKDGERGSLRACLGGAFRGGALRGGVSVWVDLWGMEEPPN